MSDFVPKLSQEDISRIVDRDYPAEDRASILAELTRYGDESWHHEPIRVRVAILKVANGKAARIAELVRAAKVDYRDVLSSAEYPNSMKVPPGCGEEVAELRRRAREDDLNQYLDWLERG